MRAILENWLRTILPSDVAEEMISWSRRNE